MCDEPIGSAMLPGWPALCLVCQRERGVVWPTSERPVCLCGRDADKDQASLTLVYISETAVGLYGHVLASQER